MSWHDIAGSADSINMNDDVTMLYTANFILGPPDIFKAKVWPTLDQYIGLKKRPMYWSRPTPGNEKPFNPEPNRLYVLISHHYTGL